VRAPSARPSRGQQNQDPLPAFVVPDGSQPGPRPQAVQQAAVRDEVRGSQDRPGPSSPGGHQGEIHSYSHENIENMVNHRVGAGPEIW